MKKILPFLFIVCAISMSSCATKDTWQGTYYKNGLQENEMYGPVFTNYNGCKAWALGKIENSEDKVICSKNCHDALESTPICEEVVRNWIPLPGSNTFDNYKE